MLVLGRKIPIELVATLQGRLNQKFASFAQGFPGWRQFLGLSVALRRTPHRLFAYFVGMLLKSPLIA